MNAQVWIAAGIICGIIGIRCPAQDTPGDVGPMAARCADLAAKADTEKRTVIAGNDGWLFLPAELRHLGVGRFWGDVAPVVSRSTRKDAADPLPAILDFQKQLNSAGIELILLPVPPKAAVYPEMLPGESLSKDQTARAGEMDSAFLRMCSDQGIKTIDLAPIFRAARNDDAVPLYCRTDSHWSGQGCVVAAQALAKDIRERAWFAAVPKRAFKGEWRETQIKGDLAGASAADTPAETVRLRFASDEEGAIPGDWRESPIVLLGDSHTLVFHAGDEMHGAGAGLADQLAIELGFAADVVGVRGSGATPARINLLRRQDNMAGKKLVIWCFAAREFTEAPGGWRLVPVIKGK